MDIQRLVLFVVFSFSLLMLWENWQKEHAPQTLTTITSPANVANVNAPIVSSDIKPAINNTLKKTDGVLTNGAQVIVNTDLVRAVIDADGGDIRSLAMLRYRDPVDTKKYLNLFEQSANHVYVAQSGLVGAGLPNHKSVYTLAANNYVMAANDNKLVVPMTWVDAQSGIKVTKSYIFYRDSYKIDVNYQLSNTGITTVPLQAYFQLLRDGKTPEGESSLVHTFTGPAFYTEAHKFTKVDFHKLDKNEAEYPKSANDGWVAMVQHHFVAAWLPSNGVKREFYANALGDNLYRAGVIVPEGDLKPGADITFTVPMYAGPQEQKTLTALAPGLDYVVDYGWLTPISAPIFWALQKIHGVVGNWGWAIVILTILIKLMFFPLSAKSYQSMAQMRGLAPKLQRLKETFGDDRQKLHQAMMDLYKTEKVNPLGGCLPVVVQIPVFIALYWALLGSVEMRQAPFILWIHDLSTPDPYYVLPIIMGITMILQTKLNPAPPDPMQAKVMMIMPVAFSIFFFFFPAGLVLYWVVNNILSISQQWVITRRYEAAQAGNAKR
ncbi:MAG: membrane protein insertase YidC [Sulfuriferula sp.]|nr:membrane protein insertase YidC [Sulfuriferula sp.]